MTPAPRVPVRPKQSLGQNFLVDDNIARRIVRNLDLSPEDFLLEIGPGRGSLTRHLAGRVHRLLAVEIDGRVVEELREHFASEKVSIIHGDFLEVSLEKCRQEFGAEKLRIVGNIPYHLTSPILFKLFEEYASVSDCTIMMQHEVARRLTAKPRTKARGILSVFTQFYGEPKLLFDVSPNCFYPKPKVRSTMVRIRFREALPGALDDEIFRNVVKTTFGKRRKTLRGSLQYLPYHECTVGKIVDELDFPLDRRPEELSVAEFVTLTEQIQTLLQ